jgi:hypothetical protein
MITTAERDFLEQDPAIRNQNYVCLSFISPEEMLKKKEVYFFEQYIKIFSKKANELLNELETVFPDNQHQLRMFRENFDFVFDGAKLSESYNYYIMDREEELNKEFDTENDFKTSVRGIKVRGVYDTLVEAEHRSEQLRKLENNKFSIYIAEVGCWCPWYPNPDKIQSQNYADTELNTLMSKYEENLENKEQFYNDRKHELMNSIKSEQKSLKEQNETQNLEEAITGEDPWMNQTLKDENETIEVKDESVTGPTETQPSSNTAQ